MKIDLNKLVDQYYLNLTDKLRGFGEEEFLKFWVPDTDKAKTLLNLIDALYESNTLEAHIINIDLQKNELKEISKLKDIAFSTINEKEIIIKIDPDKYKEYKIKNKSVSSSEINERIFENIDKLEPKNTSENIDEFYLKAAEKHTLKNCNLEFDEVLGNQTINYNIILSKNQIVKIFVNLSDGNIIKAYHKNQEHTKITKIIDIFCDIINNVPLQEAAEHGTIRLEFILK